MHKAIGARGEGRSIPSVLTSRIDYSSFSDSAGDDVMPFALSSLVSSIDALRRSLRAIDGHAGQLSSDLEETLRAGSQ